MCATNTCPICQYYKSVFGKDDPLLQTMRMRSKKKKHRSIDEAWEDSSTAVHKNYEETLVTFDPTEVEKLNQRLKEGTPISVRILKPVERHYYAARVHNIDGTVTPVQMQVSKAMHERIMKAMGADDDQQEESA